MPPKKSPKKAEAKEDEKKRINNKMTKKQEEQKRKKILIGHASDLSMIENHLDNNLAHDIWPEMKFHNKDNTQYEFFSKKCNGSILKYIEKSSPYYVDALMNYMVHPYKLAHLADKEDSEDEEDEEESEDYEDDIYS